ncbi:hypothetical protein K505DRAFT_325025 [Melanomma pulvis-pyrius CBS 109.77]|uniref:Uncharacterized protein n=1 Tax=Melanomma pulvis-pyrius CBS 109.77 TaxID=1314802 RepID=A0A6A6XCL1_9PLEO|nr:hypothetical protein K505DRAFT_325025 [Melanomma pulvis-pyrius CBS 109.77]
MQNYAQGYQRPGSTASFAGQPGTAPPPPYGGAPHAYTSASPIQQSQWAPPAQTQPPQQQWSQSPQTQQGGWGGQQQQQQQQQTGGYNPGVYGAMPGAYGQGQPASVNQPSNPYNTQQQDQPPPPPPKPHGFASTVQQQQQQQQQQPAQTWGQQPAYGAQPTQQGYPPQQQTGYPPQQGSFQAQQSYNTAAPPPPSQTPGGSYFPPSQQGQTPSSYGADQTGGYPTSTPASATTAQPPNSVLSPDVQHPTYIPPSLTGQGVQSYMPANTNPLPGVYIPPPPDMPAWQQASHAPLQGGNKKFRYTKPMVDPSFQAQGYQGLPQQPVQQPGQFVQQPVQGQQQYGQPVQNQFQPQTQMPQQGQYGQPVPQQPQDQFQQQQQHQQQYGQPPMQPPSQLYPQQGNQWQQPPPADPCLAQPQQQPPQQQGWPPAQQAQAPVLGQPEEQGIQAPKPINGQTGTTAPNFVSDPSPKSQPVSPVHNRNSMSFSQSNAGRTGSVSSIALGAIHSQRAGNRTSSPASIKAPVPPPTTETKAFSALGFGGPSDWEHFGDGEEIDDEEIFGVKKDEKKTETAHSDSVELPAHVPSPPPTQAEWPTPPAQPAPLNLTRRDTYQPTPPPDITAPPAQPQAFVMGDAIVAPAVTQSPQPGQFSQPPPPNQQGFPMHNSRGSSRHGTPAQHQQQYQPPPNQQGFAMHNSRGSSRHGTPSQLQQQYQPPPPAGNTFIADDGGWAAQSNASQGRQQTPAQQYPQQAPPAAWGAAEQTPTQTSGWGGQAQNQNFAAELQAKDEAFERFRADAERESADLRAEIDKLRSDAEREKAELRSELERLKDLPAEIERLKVEAENAKTHAASEKNVLSEQIEEMKVAAAQAKDNSEAVNKEKVSMIEWLKEDAEGKDDAIKEKDVMIADLKQQLEVEKASKPIELPQPTPRDLIPDIDPWYAGSLERYISMLRSEAGEQQVDDKINVFTGFLRAESSIRGLEYYSAPPPAPPMQDAAHNTGQEPFGLSRGASNASIKKPNVNVQVPQRQPSPEDEFQYSPGGRPLLQRKPTMPSTESVSREQSFGQSFGFSSGPEQLPQISTANEFPQKPATILTPTSSTDEGFNKGPIQSPPEETAGQYKAFVPQEVTQNDSVKSLHRQSMSFTPPAYVAPLHGSKSSKGHDEIFFGAPNQQPSSKPSSRPTTSASAASDVPLPAPLSFTPAPLSFNAQPSAAAASPKKNPAQILNEILPAQIVPPQPHTRLEGLWKKSSAIPSDFAYINDLTVAWEKNAALARKKNDAARRKRQEESEEHTDQLFNDNEISYADIGDLEDEFKEKERELKAQEDRVEYKTYVEEVFDKVYDGLQAEIKSLMDLYIESENLLQTSVSGVKTMDGKSDAPSTHEALELLKTLHAQIETRHDKVAQAVAERDKRYKRTEIQPLYAAGNIAKMKNVEKHFDNAEKQAALRAKGERSERIGELVHVVEDVVIAAVGFEQDEADHILNAARALAQDNADESHTALLTRARDTLLAIKASSIALLGLFNALEVELNTAVLEAEIAQAKAAQGAVDPARILELEKRMEEGEKEMKLEFERRVGVLEADRKDVEALVKGGVSAEEREKSERERRLKAALEEAKRRNGQ